MNDSSTFPTSYFELDSYNIIKAKWYDLQVFYNPVPSPVYKYLLNICVLSRVLDAGDRVVNNADTLPGLTKLIFYWDRQTNQQIKMC